MGYGLEFYGDNGQLIFDTDNFSSAQILTIQDGHPTNLANNSTVSVPSDALMFARVSSGNLYGVKNFSTNAYTNKSGQSISYFFARETNSVGNISGSGTYGLEIYGPPDSQGNQEVTFSTRRVANSTLNFKRVHDHNALADTESVYSGSTSNIYVSVDYQFYNSSNEIITIINGFYWTSSNIRYDGYIDTQEGSEIVEAEITNKGTIAVVSLRTS